MRKAILAVIGLAAVAALMAPALGLGSADGRKVLDAKVLGAVSEPYTGGANAIRGVSGGGLPWEIGDASADLRADGRLHVEVDGLVLARRAPVPANLQGTNPVPQFGAVVSCLTTVGGAATTARPCSATDLQLRPALVASGGGSPEDELPAVRRPRCRASS